MITEEIAFLILKLKKEDEICRLQLEVLEMEGKSNTAKYKKIKRLRGEKCFERVNLEMKFRALEQEQSNIA